MSEKQYKEAAKSGFIHGAAPGEGQSGAPLPARADSALPEAVFLNPGPKAAILGLALLVMTSYGHFMHGFGSFGVGALPGGTPIAPVTPPQTGTQPGTQTPGTQAGTTQPQGGQEAAPQTGATSEADEAAEAHRQRMARFNRTPRLLNSQTFTGDNFTYLSLQSSTVTKAVFTNCNMQNFALYKMRMEGCVFNGSDLSKSNIRDVVFENCTFENSNIDESTLFGVSFVNCTFTGTKRENGFSKSRFALSRLYKVTFEKVKLEDFLLFQNSGSPTFKDSDITGISLSADGNNASFPKISGAVTQFELRLENCTGGDFELSLRNLPAQLKITKSNFDNVKMHDFTQIDIADSTITGKGYIKAADWLVVKNSTLCADFTANKAMYMVNNTYKGVKSASRLNSLIKDDDGLYQTTNLRPYGGAECYIIGGADGAWLTTYGGKINISDLKIRMGYFELDYSRGSSELNLKNVELDKSHIFNSELDAAYWENVKIKNPMTSRNARGQKPLAVRMVNVSLPAGQPWIDSTSYSVEEVMPRAWPKPEIPGIK